MDKVGISSRIWLRKGGKNYLGKGRIELLKHIQKEGSILKASKKMYMSYKAAWDDIHQINEIAGKELVLSSNGGKGGGGTRLTQEGEKAIRVFERLEGLQDRFLEKLDACQDLDDLLARIAKWEEKFDELENEV